MKQFLPLAAALGIFTGMAAQAGAAEPIKNIVLVHGAYADGSGWRGVAEILQTDGYKMTVVQEPETSLTDDVAATNRAIKQAGGPVILVGHSYGGIVITQAGNIPEVRGLVYVAALAPDAGENIGKTRSEFPPATNNVIKSGDGFLTLNQATFHDDFAADLPEADAAFMAISQVPINEKAVAATVSEAAWHSKPSWYAVATEDHKINPDFERFMAKRAGSETVEIKGSHAVYVSQPKAVADLIEKAATTVE
ncbi:Pimeloyl-ACP methyl ester carboxylesterase [Rhizobium sp. NFR07]|uniref:alpha/beta fold hydrolase n=1 Tax=Rhizobium sp. NFR07 TaxID=1566262 RepID=UPI0008E63955|nr:alpha/beta hydrolase [Rhizobium sp. NFR07]SFB55254.1 Pimeloyl-ACP methyl ester carboxylesterase [Rhizobium sp. NFR07]